MSKIYLFLFSALAILLFCQVSKEDLPQSDYVPILMTREQNDAAIRSDGPAPLLEPGKIYLYNNYIFIVEKFMGIHVINNTNRQNPIKINFIHIPGCVDLAIKDGRLMADNATDLITLDISNYSNVKIVNRIENVFPELPAPDLEYVPYMYSSGSRPQNTMIVKWVKK